MRQIGALILAIAALCGCANSDRDLMPLSQGQKWAYLAHPNLDSYPDNVLVSRSLPVGGVSGWELVGDLGVTHLAWNHGQLITDQMAGARFTPALPLLIQQGPAFAWRGWVETMGRRQPARATVTRSTDKQEFQGQLTEETLSTIEFKIGDREVELKTWFLSGVGIVKQEQLTNRRLDMNLTYLGKA